MGRWRILLVFALTLLGGCKSAFVNATVRNLTDHSIRLVEVDYPSASFGVQSLAPAGELHYRFKILGRGLLKLTYPDDSGRERSVTGPELHEGLDGTLVISITRDGAVQWQPQLKQL